MRLTFFYQQLLLVLKLCERVLHGHYPLDVILEGELSHAVSTVVIAEEVGHGLQSKAAGDEVVELHRLSVRARVAKNHGPDDVIVQVIAELGQGATHLSQADGVGAIPVHFVEGVDPVV